MDNLWDLVAKSAAKSTFKPRIDDWREMWPTFCGSLLAKVSSPYGVGTNGILYIEVKDPRWLPALRAEKSNIEKKIKRFPWGIREIDLRAA